MTRASMTRFVRAICETPPPLPRDVDPPPFDTPMGMIFHGASSATRTSAMMQGRGANGERNLTTNASEEKSFRLSARGIDDRLTYR